MRKRASILIAAFAVVVVVSACGRASEEEINQLLGIVPTPTLTEEQRATATARAESPATAVDADGAAENGFDASTGDVALGRQQFTFQCQQCHRADGSGTGPALVGPDNPAVALSDTEIAALVREGHANVNPFPVTRLSDRQLASIIAYIRQQSES